MQAFSHASAFAYNGACLSKRRGEGGLSAFCKIVGSINVWEDFIFYLTFLAGLKLRLRYFLFSMKQGHRSVPENVSFVMLSTVLDSTKCLY